ncbi:uncharacterized protein L969DRAFT_95466 [Mixia osmundae IAM 14324]|uniref:UBC core domain-containing protein n=1 Tax=Mixia osmundae (strain CBS 9802 / IAM 14324 / JCM 22182 / KY 12970) TaxID=764103 RepID=G7E0I7_MIXOS|nr:uncharacterized protein L969DRAFT_95466 [Mixia osmundae IAM 14324]KEI38357.1 hypothetical protein L969DRAFT_95466 [Mixia osmundae IAM 14324]GAA96347.1 hypothetical protein E5Q_03013 [Mixia osmundae IAM 14324]
MSNRLFTKRLTKELTDLRNGSCPAGCGLISTEDLQEWIISITVFDSIYEGEQFALRFRFSSGYPIDSPEVVFLTTAPYKSPEHPHIYSNGHICASILGNGWSPVLNVSSICLTLQSMLASCKKKERPPDNERYVKRAPFSPKQTQFVYHDDSV